MQQRPAPSTLLHFGRKADFRCAFHRGLLCGLVAVRVKYSNDHFLLLSRTLLIASGTIPVKALRRLKDSYNSAQFDVFIASAVLASFSGRNLNSLTLTAVIDAR
jgi:hypothetical protein